MILSESEQEKLTAVVVVLRYRSYFDVQRGKTPSQCDVWADPGRAGRAVGTGPAAFDMWSFSLDRRILGTKQGEHRPSLHRFISTYSWAGAEDETCDVK